ncbi:MAG: hydrogenase maturation protease [Candidatus Hydrothermarchaeota archaeon]
MKTLILGIGNPLLRDDGVGIHVIRKMRELNLPDNIYVSEASVAGLDLLDFIIDYQRVIIVDAIKTEEGEPGEIYRLKPQELPKSQNIRSTHVLDLPTVLETGRILMEERMPEDIIIYAIEIEDCTTFDEKCTQKVEESIPRVIQLILDDLGIERM